MKRIACLFFIHTLLTLPSIAQKKTLEVYLYENHNRGYVANAQIQLIDFQTSNLIATQFSNEIGYAKFFIDPDTKYNINVSHTDFQPHNFFYVSNNSEKQFVKMAMERQTGYIFDVTIAEERPNTHVTASGIVGCQIEIYNRTQKKTELFLKDFEHPNFQFVIKPGNHYTMMIRKENYVARRVEIYANVEGCILCIDGISELNSGVLDNISSTGFGSVLANIELKKAEVGKSFQIKNINYDFDKYNIRPDAAKILNGAVAFFTDNPRLELELGSHTDSRGNDEYNLTLSQKRAESAMNYLISRGVDPSRISFKGYGESMILNHCKNEVPCTDKEHEVNRRTELKIVGVRQSETEHWYPLERIITEEEFANQMFTSVKTHDIAEGQQANVQEASVKNTAFPTDDNWSYYKSDFNYFISLGAFKKEQFALQRVKQLSRIGINKTEIVFLKSAALYYIVGGLAKSKAEAELLAAYFQKKNIDVFIKPKE